MASGFLRTVFLLWLLEQACFGYQKTISKEGSFAFKEAENRRPPRVKKPPYTQSRILCPGVNSKYYIPEKYQSLCGDLNEGFIPVNPMGQAPLGEQYPFVIIKKKALTFFAKTIPTLKKDEHVPKVAMFEGTAHHTRELGGADYFGHQGNGDTRRLKRSFKDENNNFSSVTEEKSDVPFEEMDKKGGILNKASNESKINSTVQSSGTDITAAINDRFAKSTYENVISNLTNLKDVKNNLNVTRDQARQFLSALCDGQDNILCTLMSFIMPPQKTQQTYEKTDEEEEFYQQHVDVGYKQESDVGPGTPCPSYNEYVTPTYARNHHGSWRYVVQIPYEGYFTQTIQVTRCRNTNCAYLEGSCKSSPRWVSLLVAEIYYPELYYPLPTSKKPQNPEEYVTTSPKYPSHRPNEKVNVGPFIRPLYNKTPTKKDIKNKPNLSSLGSHYQQTATANSGKYYQSISGQEGNKDSFLRTDDISIPISTDDFYEYQQYLQQVASSQRKAKKTSGKDETERIKIRTKRKSSFGISSLSNQQSVLNWNLTSSNLSQDPSKVNSEHHCDGYDNLGCFVVRMYYDWFVVSGECKCWKDNSRHPLLH